jgi:hypothetical protein
LYHIAQSLLVPLFVSASRELEEAVAALEAQHLVATAAAAGDERGEGEEGRGNLDDQEADVYSSFS